MAHLKSFRIGWENENLALFLLSRIAFVANPVSVSDDIGSDFICTLFAPREVRSKEQLFPVRSFAIQVKSNRDAVDVSNKLEYLDSLELPFILGVVQQADLSLSLYSGEFLPIMLTELGRPKKLILCPSESESIGIRDAYVRDRQQCELELPFLAKLGAKDNPEVLDDMRRTLEQRCLRMQSNISTRRSKEYIFRIDDTSGVLILAGPASVTTFRNNHYLRLAEVFYNLDWLLRNAPQTVDQAELDVYIDHYNSLERSGAPLPQILRKIAKQLLERLEGAEEQNP